MPYSALQYSTGSTVLPFTLLDGRYDLSTSADSPTPGTPLLNGEFDDYGDERAPRKAQTVKIEETYLGSGYNDAIKAWKAVHRTKGRLYRQDDETGEPQWTPARLKAIPITRTIDNAVLQGIGLTFYLYNPIWYGLHHGLGWYLNAFPLNYLNTGLYLNEQLNRQPLTAGGSTPAVFANGGDEQIDNAVVTVNAGDTAVTSVRFVQTSLGIDFTWAGTLAIDKSLVIDFGAQTVKNDGVAAYSGITRNAGYTVDAPLAFPLPPGSNTYTITLVGGGVITPGYIVADYSDGSN